MAGTLFFVSIAESVVEIADVGVDVDGVDAVDGVSADAELDTVDEAKGVEFSLCFADELLII